MILNDILTMIAVIIMRTRLMVLISFCQKDDFWCLLCTRSCDPAMFEVIFKLLSES